MYCEKEISFLELILSYLRNVRLWFRKMKCNFGNRKSNNSTIRPGYFIEIFLTPFEGLLMDSKGGIIELNFKSLIHNKNIFLKIFSYPTYRDTLESNQSLQSMQFARSIWCNQGWSNNFFFDNWLGNSLVGRRRLPSDKTFSKLKLHRLKFSSKFYRISWLNVRGGHNIPFLFLFHGRRIQKCFFLNIWILSRSKVQSRFKKLF